jgi:regulator of sigma E protease
VLRAGKPVALVMRPDSARKQRGVPRRDTVVGQIGALAFTPTSQIPLGWGGAIEQGAALTWNAGGLVLRSLRQLATGAASFKELGGPIAIGGAAAHAAKRGWADLITLLGLLSINLAVFNLLPVPLLDGGQIVVLVAEQIKGGALSLRTREYLMRAGLAFILLLLAVVMFNDIPRLIRMFMKQ